MHLKQLRAENFKNCEAAKLSFSTRLNAFAGPNGAGKTNLLDAIYFLCSGKSYFNAQDAQLIRDNENYFSLKGSFHHQGKEEEILCVLMRGRRKVIKRNDTPYKRLIEHYGEFPAVMVSPGDVDLIMGGSEERRRWIDSTISMHDRDYLLALIQYEKVLEQRNAEIRRYEDISPSKYGLLEVYDSMLIEPAEEIYEKRKSFFKEFQPWFERFHKLISQEREQVSLRYESQLSQNTISELLPAGLRKDVALQRTTAGIHKDDLTFEIEGSPLKKFGSQGQQKTFLLALKLAQHQYTKAMKGFAPLLLLDDVCERLDEARLETLFSLIAQSDFGQVFVTDSSVQRIGRYLRHYNPEETKVFEVEKGIANELGS
jgi:DNA replication and repair protein RecF